MRCPAYGSSGARRSRSLVEKGTLGQARAEELAELLGEAAPRGAEGAMRCA